MHSAALTDRCMNAWLHCETLLGRVDESRLAFSQRTRRVLDECAALCLGTLEALRSGGANASGIALLCVGICAECAEVCGRYPDSGFQFCADACSSCAAALLEIAG